MTLRPAPMAALASLLIAACGGSDPVTVPDSEAALPAAGPDFSVSLGEEEDAPVYVETRSIIDHWPGANPPGIAILEDVEILGRDSMRPYEAVNRVCPLPKYANFEPGNNSRNQRHGSFFYTASEPATITVTGEMSVFNPAGDGVKLDIKPSDELRFMGVEAVNWVNVELNGEPYELEIDALSKHSNVLDILDGEGAKPVLWLRIICENDIVSWFIYDEMVAHPDIAPSLNDPMKPPADLTDEDIAAIRAKEG